MTKLSVKIAFDEKSKVWGTWDSEVPGLTAWDQTRDGLVDQIEIGTPELLDLSRQSTCLVQDSQYDIEVIEQMPYDPANPATPVKSFSVALPPVP